MDKPPAKRRVAPKPTPPLKPDPVLIDTQLAALYVLMHLKPKERVQLFRAEEIRRAKNRVYNMARDGKLTRHGGEGWGEAKWDLGELDKALRQTP